MDRDKVRRVTSSEAHHVCVSEWIRQKTVYRPELLGNASHTHLSVLIYAYVDKWRKFLWWEWYGLSEHKIGQLYLRGKPTRMSDSNSLMDDSNWVMEVFGKEKEDLNRLKILAKQVEREFKVNVHVRLCL